MFGSSISWIYHMGIRSYQKSRNNSQIFISIFFSPTNTKCHISPFMPYSKRVNSLGSDVNQDFFFLSLRLSCSLAVWEWRNYLTSLSFSFVIISKEIIIPPLQGVVGNKWYMYVNIPASVPSTRYDTINSTYYIVRTIYIVAFKDWQYSRISESFIILMYWT